AGDILRIDTGDDIRYAAYLACLEPHDIGHAIDHDADDAATEIENDDDGKFAVLDLAHIELHAQIHDGHDLAAQVDDPLDEGRRIGNLRDGIIATDFLHLEDIEAIRLTAQNKCQ